jgi:hypothetical protein
MLKIPLKLLKLDVLLKIQHVTWRIDLNPRWGEQRDCGSNYANDQL